ncbi:SET domain-containing protein 3-like [Sitodiplosis mosellana]|uniref:SET domain-containing protein 3-like n=1 Tax=Sitodiplosis mosellana TaxID=263140 RepID=UPI00244452D3|nr:SET domain-containing protein 3-like [Sitodiplosis mosellana]
MDLLWKKEADGSYIDIFGRSTGNSNLFSKLFSGLQLAPAKNNTKSTEFRQNGNDQKAKERWYHAMRFYNESLSYAENGSPNVSLAYANRSLCFLKMEMYDKCITDINFAIKANYPKEKRFKLDERRAYCLERINNEVEILAPAFDFDANENYVGFSNVLDIKFNEKFGRHVVAKCDIAIGKTVLIEEAFGPAQLMDAGQCVVCNTCYKNTMNFIPCEKCPNTLFCNQTCIDNNKFHKFVCGEVPPPLTSSVMYDMTSVLFAIDIFQNVDSLIQFVESVINDKSKTKVVPSAIGDMKSKYRIFLQLNLLGNAMKRGISLARARNVYEKLMGYPTIKTMFSTKAKKRFFIHLCVLHVSIVLSNLFNTNTISGTYLLRSFFNHSCAPNVLFYHYENKCIGITSRLIRKGEQLFMIYNPTCWSTPLNKQPMARIEYEFQCDCEKCKSTNWPNSSKRIKSDPDIQYIESFMSEANGPIDDFSHHQNYLNIQQRCINVLNKYGNLPWTTELNMVSRNFELILSQACLFSPINFGNLRSRTENKE